MYKCELYKENALDGLGIYVRLSSIFSLVTEKSTDTGQLPALLKHRANAGTCSPAQGGFAAVVLCNLTV